MRRRALVSTAMMLAWLGSDLVRVGGAISAGDARPDEAVSWLAVAWLALCVATRAPVAPVWPGWATMAAVAVSLLALPTGLLLTPGPMQSSMAGDVLLLTAALLLGWSAAALGKRFTLLPAALGLQRAGPYRYVRHPMYASYMLGSAGVALHLPHATMVAACLVEGVALWVRAHAEERALAALPGHADYCAGTRGWFIPRLIRIPPRRSGHRTGWTPPPASA